MAAASSTATTSTEFDGIPVIDVASWMGREEEGADKESLAAECAKAAAALHEYGCLFARDPRVASADNDA
jgi:hypothetical protein